MKLIVFGATGSVGRQVVAQAKAAKHDVTAFSRHPDPRFGVRSIQGDVLNPDRAAEAIEGQDAVICVLGDGRHGGVRAQGTANIIRGMKAHGVRRLICQTTLGAGDSRSNLTFFWKRIMFGLLLRRAYADHQLQERYVRESGLDWTIVRPAALTDGPKSGRYRTGFSATARDLALKVSRADTAHYLLSLVKDATSIGKASGLSY